MANTLLSYGKFEKVTLVIDDIEVLVGGLDTFEVGIDERTVLDVPRTFDDGRMEQIVGEKNSRSWSISGFYLTASEDTAWSALQTFYDNAEVTSGQIGQDVMKFYFDNGQANGTQYVTPSEGSYMLVTSIGPISAGREGWTTFAASGIIVGEFEEQTGS